MYSVKNKVVVFDEKGKYNTEKEALKSFLTKEEWYKEIFYSILPIVEKIDELCSRRKSFTKNEWDIFQSKVNDLLDLKVITLADVNKIVLPRVNLNFVNNKIVPLMEQIKEVVK